MSLWYNPRKVEKLRFFPSQNMSNKIKAALYTAAIPFAGVLALIAPKAHAALFEVPTTTVDSAMALVTGQLADPGTLTVLVAVVALSLIFWIIAKVIGLFPKKK